MRQLGQLVHGWGHSRRGQLLCGLREIVLVLVLGQHGGQMNDHGIDADEKG